MATIKLKYITLACVLAATVAAGSHCHNDYYQLKSVAQAQEECARYQGIPCARLAVYNKYIYPNDTQTQCMVRCMVPLSDLQQVDVLFQCANMLPFSVGRSCGRKASKRDVDCLARCFLLRSGLYSEQHGPHLDRLYVQCNNYANETRFRETTGTCYRRLKSECLDECVLAGRFLRECFYEGGLLGPVAALGGLGGLVGGLTGLTGLLPPVTLQLTAPGLAGVTLTLSAPSVMVGALPVPPVMVGTLGGAANVGLL
uniref:Uncharacterized protein n=1 Tax=Anopheles quadriannulatus TaxID=34691 RepID=A0A2C9H878_ANOQN